MTWQSNLKGDPIPWLLEKNNPSVRYLTLTTLLDRAEDDPEVCEARAAIAASEPVQAILASQASDGYWAKPGWGYTPKYQGTVWQIIFLGLLAADAADPRVRRGCEYLLAHSRASSGPFSASASGGLSGAIHCLNGNLIYALLRLGYRGDPRLDDALDWLARSITGNGFEPKYRYYKSGLVGPGFLCADTNGLACAWGAVKALMALGAVPEADRSEAVQEAIEASAEFLLGNDLAHAAYPTGWGTKPSSVWFKFGFPLGYTSDVLEALLALGEAGYGADPRLKEATQLVLSKQDERGRWRLDNSLNGKMWTDIEAKRRPSKWVTWRALRALKLGEGGG